MRPFASLSLLFAIFSCFAFAEESVVVNDDSNGEILKEEAAKALPPAAAGDAEPAAAEEAVPAAIATAAQAGADEYAVAVNQAVEPTTGVSKLRDMFKRFKDKYASVEAKIASVEAKIAAEKAFADGMAPLQNKLKEVGDKLLDIEDENVDKDFGVEKSVEGDWNVKSRERMAKRHQQGVNSLKAGVSRVKDMDKKDVKAHEVRKLALEVKGSDPDMEREGKYFRSVQKSQMVKKEWQGGKDILANIPSMMMDNLRAMSHLNFMRNWRNMRNNDNNNKNDNEDKDESLIADFATSRGVPLSDLASSWLANQKLRQPTESRQNDDVKSIDNDIDNGIDNGIDNSNLHQDIFDDDVFVHNLEDKIAKNLRGKGAEEKFRRNFDAALASRRTNDAVNAADADAALDQRRVADAGVADQSYSAVVNRFADDPAAEIQVFPDGDGDVMPWRRILLRRRPTFFIRA